MIKDFLSSLGMSEREAEIYKTLLEREELLLSEIALKTRINRVALYEVLPQMVEDGFVEVIVRGKRKYYRSANPEKLEEIYEKQRLEFDRNIASLKKVYDQKKERPIVTFREGASGVREAYEDIVISAKKDETIYRYTSKITHDPATRSDKYYKLRESKGLQRYVITSEDKATRKKEKLDRQVRYIPKKKDLFDDDVSQIIYANKVTFIDHANQAIFTIESTKIAAFQKKLFMLLFKGL